MNRVLITESSVHVVVVDGGAVWRVVELRGFFELVGDGVWGIVGGGG